MPVPVGASAQASRSGLPDRSGNSGSDPLFGFMTSGDQPERSRSMLIEDLTPLASCKIYVKLKCGGILRLTYGKPLLYRGSAMAEDDRIGGTGSGAHAPDAHSHRRSPTETAGVKSPTSTFSERRRRGRGERPAPRRR